MNQSNILWGMSSCSYRKWESGIWNFKTKHPSLLIIERFKLVEIVSRETNQGR